MIDEVSKLFEAFDRGRLSRRKLLQLLGLAVAAKPMGLLAQGRRRGALSEALRDTSPADLPFAPTGWKTLTLDHLSCEVEDHQKEAAYYNALMNWQVRSADAKEVVLDIGDWGSMRIRGGYKAPPAPPPAAGAQGAGRGGRAGQAQAPRAPANAKFTSFAWGITPWDPKKVEAELKTRGLAPMAETIDGNQYFHIKDPDGWDVLLTDGNRKQPAGKATLSAPAPFAHTSWKTIWLDHISFEVPDYKKSVDFYGALLGWKPGTDEGNQNQVEAGEAGDLIIRNGGGGRGGAAPRGVNIGHISYGISPWSPDPVKAELEKRGLPARDDTGGRGDIHTAGYQSYHTSTPNGYDLQISFVDKAGRTPPPAPKRG